MGAVVVLVMMLTGMLPAWQVGGALPAQALPSTQRATVPVIIEVARGANPAGVAQGSASLLRTSTARCFRALPRNCPAEAIRAINPNGAC